MFQIWTHDIGGQKYIFLGCVERGHHIDSCWNNHSFGRPSPRGQESDQATRSWPGTCQSWWGNWLPWWACTSPRTYRACTPWEEEEGCKEVGKIPGLPPTLVGGERTSTQQADGGARCSLHSSSCQELLRKSVWMWTMWLCFRHTAWSESAHRQKAQEHWSSSRWRTWSVSCPLWTQRWSTRWHRFNCWRRQREPKRWGGFFIHLCSEEYLQSLAWGWPTAQMSSLGTLQKPQVQGESRDWKPRICSSRWMRRLWGECQWLRMWFLIFLRTSSPSSFIALYICSFIALVLVALLLYICVALLL